MTRKLYFITVLIMMVSSNALAFYFGQHFGWEGRHKGLLGVALSSIAIVAIWFQLVKAYDRGPL